MAETKKKDIPEGISFFLERAMGVEPLSKIGKCTAAQ